MDPYPDDFPGVADPDPVGSGRFSPDPDPVLSLGIRIRPIKKQIATFITEMVKHRLFSRVPKRMTYFRLIGITLFSVILLRGPETNLVNCL